MARLSKEEQARYAGAEWAIKLVEEKGLEEAKKELHDRGTQHCPLKVAESDRRQYLSMLFERIYKSFVTLTLITLKDEFEMDKQDMRKFYARFENKAECINKDFVNWDELETILSEEIGAKISDGKIYI